METLLLLYSKYSPQSQKLFGMINEAPDSIPELQNVSFLCIDNEKVRSRVKNFKVPLKQVPCMLVISQQGVEVYDTNMVFEWVGSLVSQIIQLREQELQRQQQEMLERERRERNENNERKENNKNNEEDDESFNFTEEYTDNPMAEHLARNSIRSDSTSVDENMHGRSTMIDSQLLQDIENEEEFEANPPIRRPPVSIRSDKQNYEHADNYFSDEQPDTRRGPSKAIKASGKRSEKDPHGTLEAAKMLAQGREEIEHTIQSKNPRSAFSRKL